MLHTTASIQGKAGTLLRSSGVRNLNGKKTCEACHGLQQFTLPFTVCPWS